jgi:hypothetical protein
MNRQRQIEAFSLSLHRLAVSRLRSQPALASNAERTLSRWHDRSGPNRAEPYFDRWRQLLAAGADAIEAATCVDTDHAAVLRSVSPLGSLVSPAERKALLEQARRRET